MSEGAYQRELVPGASEALLALEKLLADPDFCLSDRNRRFLSFVVAQSIYGFSDRIKGYTIGVDVFGRSETFDADSDPIVRVEATRIRAALAHYYEGPGTTAAFRFALPKGSYAPVFYRVNTHNPISNGIDVPDMRILIENKTAKNSVELGVRSDIYLDTITALLKREPLKVWVSPPHGRRVAAEAFQAMYLAPQHTFALDAALRPMQAAQRYTWRLASLETAEILCNGFFDRSEHDCQATIDQFIGQVVAEVISTLLQHRTRPLSDRFSAEINHRSVRRRRAASSADKHSLGPILPGR